MKIHLISSSFIFTLIALSFLLLGRNVSAQNDDHEERVIVQYREFTPPGIMKKIAQNYGSDLGEELKLKNTYVLKVSAANKNKAIAELKHSIFVEYAEEDFPATSFVTPNDPEYANQWGLTKIDAANGWEVSRGADTVTIAIVDTGIKYNHPDLQGKIDKSVNCTQTNCPLYQSTDPDGHGTHVAGIAASLTDNNLGVAGVAWNTKLMSVKVLDDNGRGYYSWISNGIIWAADNGADVINLSLGGTSYSSTLENAVNYAWNNGVIIAAAAGNSGSSQATYPAYHQKVIAVGATDNNDARANFSNYGSWVDVAAPGVSIYSTYKNGYAYLSGTSMSTPFVTGLAALVKSQNPGFSNTEIRNRIETSSVKLSGSNWIYGRIDICAALLCSPVFTPTPVPTLASQPSPTAIPTVIPTLLPTVIPTLTPVPTAVPTNAITPILTPIPTTIPTPSPTTSPKPWFCKYVPWHYLCQ